MTAGQVKIQGIKLVPTDCDFSGWSVWAAGGGGTLVEATAEHIIVHAVTDGFGNWYAGVKSPGVNTCCCNVNFMLNAVGALSAIGG